MKRLFFVFAFIIPLVIHAQTIKTDVLVIGNGDAAYAASFQAFKSGVKTILLNQKEQLDLSKIPENKRALLPFYQSFLNRETENAKSLETPKPKPDKKNRAKVTVADSSLLLNVINNTPYTEIKRSGNGWEVKLTQDRSIKAKVLVLADNPEKLLAALKISTLNAASSSPLNYSENAYRTTVSKVSSGASFLSLYSLLIPNQENLLYISHDQFEIGRAAGATAAYAAFFSTKASLSNLKSIQAKLLAYKHALMPFEDVKTTDSNWLAIQKIGVTGIIKAEIKQNKAYFNPEKEVTDDEVRQPIKDYYYKAQIWFDDHQHIPINLENTISMVCYVGNKSVDATKAALQKKWNKNYRFTSKYELTKVLTRRELAVIINDFLETFDKVNVDKTGRVIR